MSLDAQTLTIGLAVFAARIVDQSLSTVRTIAIVQGRKLTAFFLGFVEVTIWLTVISQVLNKVKDEPWLGLFYALGFSTGNYLGILLEKRLAIGNVMLRVISSRRGREIAETLRQSGHAVTTFSGEGKYGPVLEVLVVCPRRMLNGMLARVRAIEPDAFYVTESTSAVSRLTGGGVPPPMDPVAPSAAAPPPRP
jgi:uncharacterized protein YebE (UPF0316 family)